MNYIALVPCKGHNGKRKHWQIIGPRHIGGKLAEMAGPCAAGGPIQNHRDRTTNIPLTESLEAALDGLTPAEWWALLN